MRGFRELILRKALLLTLLLSQPWCCQLDREETYWSTVRTDSEALTPASPMNTVNGTCSAVEPAVMVTLKAEVDPKRASAGASASRLTRAVALGATGGSEAGPAVCGAGHEAQLSGGITSRFLIIMHIAGA